jgi:hypothetical protein
VNLLTVSQVAVLEKEAATQVRSVIMDAVCLIIHLLVEVRVVMVAQAQRIPVIVGLIIT